ncbi:hypothetical protein A7982_13389 [Minicystis rosea]|nr:hypothetical protein A7982_13389 [Minicystis rosea]
MSLEREEVRWKRRARARDDESACDLSALAVLFSSAFRARAAGS